MTKETRANQSRVWLKKSYAIVVGINDYQDGLPILQNAVPDARALAAALSAQHGYEVQLLPASDGAPVTADILLDTVKSLTTTLTADDRFLFYFAGHGLPPDSEASSSDARKSGYLVAQNASRHGSEGLLSMDELYKAIDTFTCRHVLIFLDCCFAGAFRWARVRQERHFEAMPEVTLYRERFERFASHAAQQLITSTWHDELALDAVSGSAIGARGEKDSHSPFAAALLDALKGKADRRPTGTDRGDGIITATELYLYLDDALNPRGPSRPRQTVGFWPLEKHDRGQYFFLVPGVTEASLRLPEARELNAQNNPYRALHPYDSNSTDRRLFYGRAAAIANLTTSVIGRALTVIVGPSGNGKSSLLRAGLNPTLRERADWIVPTHLVPGATPIESLVSHLEQQLAISIDRTALATSLAAWLAGQNRAKRVLLCIDQFEEVITYSQSTQTLQTFCALLEDLLAACSDRLRLVLAVRSDFEVRILGSLPTVSDSNTADARFAERWRHSRYEVPALTPEELREVITGPATERVMLFDPPELIDKLIHDVWQNPGALPLLSFTLSELYLRCVERGDAERRLTLSDYASMGYLSGSLSNRADALLAGMDPPARATLRRLMLRLCGIEGPEPVKRRIPLSELEYEDPAENARVKEIVSQWLDVHRLLVSSTLTVHDNGTQPPESSIEPAHDALVKEWGTLGQWLAEAQKADWNLTLHRRLTVDALSAVGTGQLWHNDPRLPLAERAFRDDPAAFNRLESQFLRRSIERRKVLVRRRRVAVGLAFVAVLLFAIVALQLSRVASERTRISLVASERARIAESQRLSATAATLASMQPGGRQSDELPLALLLAIEAYEVHDTVEARGALLNVLSAQPALLAQHRYHRQSNEVRNVEGIAFHPNGRWVASGGADRKVRIFDTTTNTTSKVFAPGFYVNALAFHPEGRELVVSGINDDGALIAQPFPQGKPRILQNPTGSDPTRLTFSPGGEWLVATAQDPRVLLWDWAHKAVSPKVIHDLRVAGSDDVRAMGATFSPDGQALFVPTNTGRVRMISVPEGAQIRELAHDEQRGPVFAVAVNGSNNRIATSGGNQEIKFWNLADGCPVAVNLSGLPHDISYALAFSPDGRKLAVAGEERIIRVWDLPTGLLLAQFNYHQRIATQLSFSPDGKRLASGGQDGLVAVWDVDDFQRLSTPLNAYEEMGLGGVAISADGRFIAASDGARLTLWTRSSEHDRASWVIAGPPVTTAQALLSHLAFSPDGKRLVAAGEDQMVIRDIATSYDRVVDLGPERRAVTAIGFQDNDTVLLIRRSGYWQTRNLSTGAPVREGIFTTFTNVTVAAISGDGSLAWATDQDLRYCSHSCFGPQPPGSQSIATSTSFDRVAFNSDGRYIAWTRSDNATVSWLSTKSTEDPVRIVVAGTAPILGLAFSDDANLLATGDSQGAIRLWDLNTSRQIGSSLANRSGRPGIVNVLRDLSFFPDGHQLLSWGQRAGTVIWDTDRASWLAQAKSLVDRNLTASEWHQFFGASTPYRRILTTLPPGDQAAELEMARQGGTSAR